MKIKIVCSLLLVVLCTIVLPNLTSKLERKSHPGIYDNNSPLRYDFNEYIEKDNPIHVEGRKVLIGS